MSTHSQDSPQAIQAVSLNERKARVSPRIAVWYPRLATAGYSGPSGNFMRLFADGSQTLSFMLVTSAARTSSVPPRMTLHRVGSYDGPLRWHQQLLLIASVFKWIFLNRRSFDVFYGLSAFHYSVAPAFFARLIGRKAVVRPAGQYDYDPRPTTMAGRMAMQVKLAMLRRVDGVVAINSQIRDWFIDLGLPSDRVCYAPNAVDTSRFQPAAVALSGEQGLTIVHIGGWTERKRLHALVQAVRLVRERGISARILSAGPKDDPMYAETIEAAVASASMEHCFTWLGEVRNIEDVYRAGNVFCLPSSAEGMPNALLEAMACGLPAVVTHLAGTADVVRNGVEGFILPQPGDDSELAGKMADCFFRYATEPGLLEGQGRAARLRVLEVFNKDVTKATIEHFFAKLSAY